MLRKYSSIRSTFIIFFVTISACGPVVTPKPTEQSATIPAITQTYTPTETITPTVTKTPTEANTPTETKIPVPEYTHGVPVLYDQIIVVKEEDKPAVLADIIATPALSSEVTKPDPLRIQLQKRIGKDDVMIVCHYGEDCIIRAVLRVKNPNGGLDMTEFVLEFREPDGTHVYMIEYVGAESSNYDKDYPEWYIDQRLQEFQGMNKEQLFYIYVTIQFNLPKNTRNPEAWSFANGALEEPNKRILNELWDSAKSGALPKDLSTIIVCGQLGPI